MRLLVTFPLQLYFRKMIMQQHLNKLDESEHRQTYEIKCLPSEDSDETDQHSRTNVFTGRSVRRKAQTILQTDSEEPD